MPLTFVTVAVPEDRIAAAMGLVVLKVALAAGAPEPLRKRRRAVAAQHRPGIWRDDRDDAGFTSIVAPQAKPAPVPYGRAGKDWALDSALDIETMRARQ